MTRHWVASGYLAWLGLNEPIERLTGLGLVVGSINLPNRSFRLRLLAFGELVEHVRGLMHPAVLFLRGGEHLGQGLPEAQGPIANGEVGSLGEPLVFEPQQQSLPTQFRFSIPHLQTQPFFVAFVRHPQDDQPALSLIGPDVEVDAIGPDIDLALLL